MSNDSMWPSNSKYIVWMVILLERFN